jgi:hypothetical protein
MKRFLVFKGDIYYPSGGWGDFVNSCDDLNEAIKLAACTEFQWIQVVDSQSGEVVHGDNTP